MGVEDGNGHVVNNLAPVAELDNVDIVAGVDEDIDDVAINGDDGDCTDVDDADVVSDGGFGSDCLLDTNADDVVPDDLGDVGDFKVEDDKDVDGVKRGGGVDSESNDGFDADNDVGTVSDGCTDDCVDKDVMGKADSDSNIDVEAASVDVVIFTETDIDGKVETAEADDAGIALDNSDPIKGADFDTALEGNGDVDTDDGDLFDSSGNEVEGAGAPRDDEDFTDVDADFDNEDETDPIIGITADVDSGVAAKFNEEDDFDTYVDLDADANGLADSTFVNDFIDVAPDSKDGDTDPDFEAVGVCNSIDDIPVDAGVDFDSDVSINFDIDSIGVVEETDVNRDTDANVDPVCELGSNSDEVGDDGDTNSCFEVVGSADLDRGSDADADTNTDANTVSDVNLPPRDDDDVNADSSEDDMDTETDVSIVARNDLGDDIEEETGSAEDIDEDGDFDSEADSGLGADVEAVIGTDSVGSDNVADADGSCDEDDVSDADVDIFDDAAAKTCDSTSETEADGGAVSNGVEDDDSKTKADGDFIVGDEDDTDSVFESLGDADFDTEFDDGRNIVAVVGNADVSIANEADVVNDNCVDNS